MEEMKTVLSKIQELYGALVEALGFVEAQKSLQEKRAIELNEQEKTQFEAQKDLDLRETEVKKIEDIVKLKEDALALKRENDDKEQKLIKEKSEIEKANKITREELATGQTKVNGELATIEKEWSLITQERAKITEDRKNMKSELIKEVLKQQVGD